MFAPQKNREFQAGSVSLALFILYICLVFLTSQAAGKFSLSFSSGCSTRTSVHGRSHYSRYSRSCPSYSRRGSGFSIRIGSCSRCGGRSCRGHCDRRPSRFSRSRTYYSRRPCHYQRPVRYYSYCPPQPRCYRKYIFLSPRGYWPSYSYRRYHYYSYHPYRWYGRTSAISENNYYIYNNSPAPVHGGYVEGYGSVNGDTFADIRQKLSAQAAVVPAEETEADRLFENGVNAFGSRDYRRAAGFFEEAMEESQPDVILPFAYVQALFADEDYYKAAEALKDAVENAGYEKGAFFYPRGLYENTDELNMQIEKLRSKAEIFSRNDDLRILLGYQLIGAGRVAEGMEYLTELEDDFEYGQTARTLIEAGRQMKYE